MMMVIIIMARKQVDAELKRMRKVLLNMTAARVRQKAVSLEIKNGLTSLE